MTKGVPNLERGFDRPKLGTPFSFLRCFPFCGRVLRTAPLDIEIHQAFIGSCTNGGIDDMRMAAEVLKGKKINSKVRLIVIPGSQGILKAMIREGILEIFIEAGASVTSPTCGPCLGGHYGILGKDEVCISTSNRNFVGRMGDKSSKVYLANPAVVAASAIEGKICAPEEDIL